MREETNTPLSALRVDGGASANNFLLQFQADILGARLIRPACVETTAWGAATLAGLGAGFYGSISELNDARRIDRVFEASMPEAERETLLAGWHRAVERTMAWAKQEK